MHPHQKYLTVFGSVALGAILLVGLLNFLVDPYDRFGLNKLGVYISAEREFKSTEFPRYASDAVLLGNSRAAIIDVAGLTNLRCFNAAFGSAQLEEMNFFVQHFVTNQKLALLSLDINSFGPLDAPVTDPFGPLTFRRAMEYTLNLKNVEYSARTIVRHFSGIPTDLQPNGSYCEAKWAAEADHADPATAHRKIQEFAGRLAPYRFDPARLAPLRSLRDTLAARHIPLIVYLAPINRAAMDLLDGTPAKSELLKTRAAIQEVFPGAIDLTFSEYAAPENFFSGDPVHFRSAVGIRFLEERVLPAAHAAASGSK